jgi:type II secretory pathway pseudopilin PulG
MRPTLNPTGKKRAFTIVELLTVMSIIVILIGLLVPALNKVKRYAYDVKQQAQLHAISAAIELFGNEFGGYPSSSAQDPMGLPYCGAMKLCEALMGQDLLGFHSNSVFRRDGRDVTGTTLLYPNINTLSPTLRAQNLSARKGPYLQAENANAWRLEDIYGTTVGSFLGTSFVLCDVYAKDMVSKKKTGMPILYYKADTAGTFHDPNLASSMTIANANGNIYNYLDNRDLLAMNKPLLGASTSTHLLADPVRFYQNTKSDKITTANRPFRADEYLLISAGWDGEYGTADDICNFDWKFRE